MTNKPTWADEFDGIWGHVCMDCDGVGVSLGRELQKSKQFISTKLAEQRKELITELNYTGVGKQDFNESTEHWKGRKQGVEEMKSLIINLIKQD